MKRGKDLKRLNHLPFREFFFMSDDEGGQEPALAKAVELCELSFEIAILSFPNPLDGGWLAGHGRVEAGSTLENR